MLAENDYGFSEINRMFTRLVKIDFRLVVSSLSPFNIPLFNPRHQTA